MTWIRCRPEVPPYSGAEERADLQACLVGRCKLDPGLKAPGLKIETEKDNGAFNLNLVSELAPLHRARRRCATRTSRRQVLSAACRC